jgi:hypothetical protein
MRRCVLIFGPALLVAMLTFAQQSSSPHRPAHSALRKNDLSRGIIRLDVMVNDKAGDVFRTRHRILADIPTAQ